MTYRDLARRILELSSSIVGAAQEFEALDPGITQQLLEHAESLQRLSLAADENLRSDPLPPGQARVLAFVRQFILEHKMPPTRREIAERRPRSDQGARAQGPYRDPAGPSAWDPAGDGATGSEAEGVPA